MGLAQDEAASATPAASPTKPPQASTSSSRAPSGSPAGTARPTPTPPDTSTVWQVDVPNELFGAFNPFAEEIVGDWVVRPIEDGQRKHLGDVYLDGRSFYEVGSPDEVHDPTRRERGARRLDGAHGPGPRPRPDGIRLARPGRRRRDDHLGQLP